MSMDRAIDYEEQYDKIYRYCYFKVHRRELAEDITQEAFLRFLESKSYQNTGKPLQYLYTVARNLCIDEHRKKQCEPLTDEAVEGLSSMAGNTGSCPGGSLEGQVVVSMALQEALGELTEEDRELILLRYVNEVPVTVICKLFGLSRFAVYRRTRGILEVLKDKLGKESPN